VLNAVKLMRQQAGCEGAAARVVAAADRQITHMTRLLDDLLDVSRIRNGKVELKRRHLDLREVVRDAVQACEAVVAERGHRLEVRLPGEALPVEADAVRLTQVVANLLHNAAKYTDRGGHLAVEARREGEELSVTVSDDGIGIEAAMLPRVFELFVQVEQGADRARGGLGLGLTLVKSLVERHGGRVSARSDGPGRGSAFEVRLPAAHPPAAAATPTPPPALTRPARSLDIVLVEDNADIRESLRALLELSGHAVREAEDGPRGIEVVRARPPDVALVDIGLPGVDGYEVARSLRGGLPAGTRLVAMTGYGRPEDKRQALAAGFHAHLVKPVDFDVLQHLLAELS
jgi:CheY-like chemotaxis protein/two-component sensor histidine kinase